jgi:hypothetical protein
MIEWDELIPLVPWHAKSSDRGAMTHDEPDSDVKREYIAHGA